MNARSASGGFVLVGVVMFVLALTILGLSLFAISGYEASFMGQSRDENIALYRAQGGIDMALAFLESGNLEDAQGAVGSEGVDSAYATQPKAGGGLLTAGSMNDSAVTVTVVASSRGVSRRISARFQPHLHSSSYKRLLTVAGHVDVPAAPFYIPFPVRDRFQTMWVQADSCAWISDPDVSWVNNLKWSSAPAVRVGAVPVPAVPAFIAAHPPASCFTPVYAPGVGTVTLTQHSGPGIGYYYSAPSGTGFTIDESAPLGSVNVTVAGTAVWIVPQGIRSTKRMRVTSTGPATLVIVATSPPSDPHGIYLPGGLDVGPGIQVILVTDAVIDLEQNEEFNVSNSAPELAIYCTGINIVGPHAPSTPPPSHSLIGYTAATMNPVIDALEAAGALPGAFGSSASFTFVAGSWRDITP